MLLSSLVRGLQGLLTSSDIGRQSKHLVDTACTSIIDLGGIFYEFCNFSIPPPPEFSNFFEQNR